MPKCLECGEEIDRLVYIYEEVIRKILVIENGKPRYILDDSWPDRESLSIYECPICHRELFTSHREAVAFLKESF